MRCQKATKNKKTKLGEEGVALFIVMSALSILMVLVIEFTYTSQISLQIAYGGLDELKAQYLAKAGLKLSLLRLHAYQCIKKKVDALGPTAQTMQAELQKIYSFPFSFPPTSLGALLGQKTQFEKFEKESSFEGSFQAEIKSSTHGYDLNQIIQYPFTSPSGSPSPTVTNTSSPVPQATSAAEVQAQFFKLLTNIFEQKKIQDEDFANYYRDIRIDELAQNILLWSDHNQNSQGSGFSKIKPKKAPFYHISELHFIPLVDDDIYKLLEHEFTSLLGAENTVDLNQITATEIMRYFPGVTMDEAQNIIQSRDDLISGNTWVDQSSLKVALEKNTNKYRGTSSAVNTQFDLIKQDYGISFTAEPKRFRIKVFATSGTANQTLEADVILQGDAANGEAKLQISAMRLR